MEYVAVHKGEAVKTSPLLSGVCLLKHAGASAAAQDASAPYFNRLRESHLAQTSPKFPLRIWLAKPTLLTLQPHTPEH
jgi:hypothetical protein